MFGGLIRRKLAGCNEDEFAAESTLFSLTLDVPRPTERRTDERLAAILPTAKLITEHGQLLCRIKNLSAGGFSAELAAPLPAETQVEVEFGHEQRIPGVVVWTRKTCVGIRFDSRVDLRQLLSNRRPREGFRPRPPRLEVNCSATVRIGKLYHRVEMNDISLGGLKVKINDWNCVGQSVVVTVDSLRPIKGRVRWYKGGQAGIVFDAPLRFEELAEWLGKRLEIASMKTGAWDRPRR